MTRDAPLAAQSDTQTSIWAPLRTDAFRAMYIAVLVSNIGSWMQTVGAQWLLVDQPNASVLVALVQVMDTAPDLLFAVIGGVLADIFDRRTVLISVQGFLVVVGAALSGLTLLGQMPPALLLTFTFLLGAGSAFSVPAYQAIIPELVPRSNLSSASALGSVSINLARAVGPALAGVLIAGIGVGAVFALNTAGFLIFGVVAAAWRPPAGATPEFPERFTSALRAGAGYVRYAPVVRRMLVRTGIFLVPASVLWALLPLVATRQLEMDSAGYGLLLGALGVGAIIGAFVLPTLRERFHNNGLVVVSSGVYALVLAAVALVHSPVLVLLVLVPAGAAWVAVLSSVNAALQLFLPTWVRGRGLSVYQMVLFGSQALGAALGGLIAGAIGLVATFLVAAAAMIFGAATIRVWPLIDTRGMDRSRVVYWPAPSLAGQVDPDRGPIVVTQTYTIATGNAQRFLEAMRHVRLSRLRTGATQWGLFRDSNEPERYVELFVVASWEEHLRQHTDRLTGVDQEFEKRADALSSPPVQLTHLIAVDVED